MSFQKHSGDQRRAEPVSRTIGHSTAAKAPSIRSTRAALVLTTALAWGIAVPSVVALRHGSGGRLAGEPVSQLVLDNALVVGTRAAK